MNEFRGYEMSLETAQRFYQLCHLWKLDTKEERMALMDKLIHEENIKILTEDALKKRLKGKKVLGIQNNEKRQDSI